jgi:uncharacterized protein YkwD
MQWRVLIMLTVVLAIAPLTAAPRALLAQNATDVCVDAEEAAFLTLINTYRLANGLQPLALGQSLTAGADVHSQDMAANNFLGHTGSNGSTFSQRLADAGYSNPNTAGENVFAGDPTAAGAFAWWQNSPPHNAGMLNPDAVAIGIARAHNPNSTFQWYWTTTFGLSPDAAACMSEAQPAAPAGAGDDENQTPPLPNPQENAAAAEGEQPAAGQTPADAANAGEQPTAQPAAAQGDQPTGGGDQSAAQPTPAQEGAPSAGGDQPAVQPTAVQTESAGTSEEEPAMQPTAAQGDTAAPAADCGDAEELALLALINDFRAQNGLPPLALGPALSAGADLLSQDMAANDFLGFTGSNGSTTAQRLAAAGHPDPNSAGDYVFAGDPTGAGAFAWWQSNAGTSADMLNPANIAIGIARAHNPNSTFQWYWTMTLGRTAEAATCAGPAAPAQPAAGDATATPTPDSAAAPADGEQPAAGQTPAEAAGDQPTSQPTPTQDAAQPTAAQPPAADAGSDQPTSQPTAADAGTSDEQPAAQPTAAQDAGAVTQTETPGDQGAAAPTAAAGGQGAVCADAEEMALLTLINDYRAQNGAPPLQLGPALTAGADAHSQDMATNDFLGHTGSNGSNFVQRLVAAGYPEAAAAGENVFAGDPTALGAFNSWKASPGHNAAMLNPNLVAIGIARANNPDSTGKWYWTTTFGTEAEATACAGTAAPEATTADEAGPTPTPEGATAEDDGQNGGGTGEAPTADNGDDGEQQGVDSDSDGLTDGDEASFGTDPALVDTDGDGVGDGDEVLLGTDPLDPESV